MRLFTVHNQRQPDEIGNRDQSLPGRQSRLLSGLLLLTAVSLAGCGDTNRPSLFRRKQYSTLPNGATIGQDLRNWPAGSTIAPGGLGVDLVRSPGNLQSPNSLFLRSLPKSDPVTQTGIQNAPNSSQ